MTRKTEGFELGAVTGLVARIAGYGSLFVFQLLLIRALGPGPAGLLFPALAAVNLLAVLGRFGLDRAGLRIVGEHLRDHDGEGARSLAGWLMALVFLITAGVTLVAVVFSPALQARLDLAGHPGVLLRVLLSAPPFALSFTAGEMIRATKRVGLAAAVQYVLPYGLASLGLLALWAMKEASLDTVSWLWLSSTCVGGLLGALTAQRVVGSGPVARPAAEARRRVWRASPAIAWTSLIVMSMNQLDVLILGAFAPGEQVSLYVAASRMALLAGLSLVGVNGIMAPLFVDFAGGGSPEERTRLGNLAQRGARWAAGMSVPVAAALILGGSFFLGIFAASFERGMGILAILLLGQVVNVSTGGVLLLMQMTGREKVSAAVLTGVVVILAPSYVLAAQNFGVSGVALVTASGVAGGNLLLVVACRASVGVNTLSDRFFPGVGLFAAAALVGLLLWTYVPAVAALVWPALAICWAGLSWAVLFRPEDRLWFRSVLTGGGSGPEQAGMG